MSARDDAIEILQNSLDKDGGELRSRHVLQAQACADALLARPDLLATMAVEADLKEALDQLGDG